MQNWSKTILATGLAVSVIFVGSGGNSAHAAPLPGKFKGETGARSDDGRISFKYRNGKISRLNVSAFVLCQDTFGNFRDFVVVATNTDNKRFRTRASGRFTAKGQDKKGIAFTVNGKPKGSRTFKGDVRLSQQRTFIDPFNPFFLGSELCAGSREWKAKK